MDVAEDGLTFSRFNCIKYKRADWSDGSDVIAMPVSVRKQEVRTVGGAHIAQGLVTSSNTVISSIPRANSLINWQCTRTSMAVWLSTSPSQFQLL